jgi:predicted acyl esterase
MFSSIHYDPMIFMPMQDGIKFMSEIYRPGDAGKYQAIVMRTRYIKYVLATQT